MGSPLGLGQVSKSGVVWSGLGVISKGAWGSLEIILFPTPRFLRQWHGLEGAVGLGGGSCELGVLVCGNENIPPCIGVVLFLR